MIRKQKGISLINIILFICIIICVIILFWILGNSEVKEAYENVLNSGEQTFTNTINISKMEEDNANINYTQVSISNSISGQFANYENKTNNEGKRYYFKQLNSTEKSMYDTIASNTYKFIDGYGKIEFSVKDSNARSYFQTVWDAVSLDRPDLFWIDTQKVSLVTTTTSFLGKKNYKYTLEPKEGGSYFIDYFTKSSEVRAAKLAIEQITDDIIQRASGSTEDKIRFVHDELVNRIEYNQESNINNSNLYGAIIEGKCVCEGYAEAFKYILDKLEIPCVTIYGTGVDNNGEAEAHAWNYVKMDNGKWYAVDVTWDDPIIIGNGKLSDKSRYRYFLKGSDNFNSTHIEDGDVSQTGQTFKYPTLSKEDY